MSTLAGDFWVCGDCRSINNAGARQCYNCRTPRDRAAVDPSSIDPSSHGRLREIELPEFHSSRWAAMLASILILAAAVTQVVQFSLAAQLFNQALAGVDATLEQWAYVGSFLIVAFGITLLALIAWALWLSRTVTSMPALGLGYPAANGMMAFIENFVPVLNLWRVPAIVRDVVRRLEPKSGGDETMTRGEALVFAAWIGLFGGFIVPRVLGFFTSDIRTLLTISAIGTGFVVIGAIFMVVLIWWVEARILRRRELQLAEDTTGPAAEAATAAEPPATPIVRDAVQTRSAFAAVSGPPSSAESFRLPGSVAPPEAPTSDGPEPMVEPEAMTVRPAEIAPEPSPPLPGPIVAPPVAAVSPEPPAPTPEADPTSAPAPAPVPPPMETAAPALMEISAPATAPMEPPAPEPVPAEPVPAEPVTAEPVTAEPLPAAPEPTVPAGSGGGPPNLTIRVTSRGMMTAEMDGEIEHVMLDDLSPYAEALSHVGGTATIVVPSDEGMAGLIVKRAQRILEDAGVQVTIA